MTDAESTHAGRIDKTVNASEPIEIREERPSDAAAVREVNRRAFGQDLEGQIVDALRSNGGVLVSLVATLDDRVIGHIMYSPATIGEVTGAALGPMAVVPEHQRQGIGSKLVAAGNQRVALAGCPFILVVGHPEFYPRFGFEAASTHGIRCEWDVPDDVFMVVVLDTAKMHRATGMAGYRPEFGSAT